MRECVCARASGDESRKGLTLKESEDEREEGAKPPLNFHSFVRGV